MISANYVGVPLAGTLDFGHFGFPSNRDTSSLPMPPLGVSLGGPIISRRRTKNDKMSQL
jgi:hypothetical protein